MTQQVWDYVITFGAALAGVLARMGQWWKPDGSIDLSKALGECAAVPAMTFVVSGGVAYMAPDLDIRVVAALSALCGIIGAAGLEAAALRLLNRKIDGE